MLSDELIALVGEIKDVKCEKQNIELKSAFEGCPQRLYDTLSAFANRDGGGIIIFGINEKADFDICGVYDPQDLQVKVNEQCKQMEPIIRPLFTVAKIEGKIVVSCEIQECDIFRKPCFYKGAGRIKGSYVRSGDADMLMTEYEIYSYEIYKRDIHDELRTTERFSEKDFDENQLNLFIDRLKVEKPNLANLPRKQILDLNGITQNGKPTVCGEILFGIYPQAFFPALGVTAVVVQGTEIGDLGDAGERFIDNKKFEGTLSTMLDYTIGFVRKNMRTSTIIDENGKRADKNEYPLKAIREIIVNALIHRDYSIHTENSPIRVIMLSNRIEVENPGGLYGRLTLDNLGKIGADTRNPYLANAAEIMLDTENRFSGIPTIRKEMEKAGMRPPLFENSRGVFKVTLFNEIIKNDSEIDTKIIEFCRIPRTREEIAKFCGFSRVSYMIQKHVMPLVAENKIEMTIPEKPKSKNQRFVSK